MSSPTQVTQKETNDLHQLLVNDPTYFWEGGSDGCFARAVLAVDRLEREGVPTGAIGKILVVHKHAPRWGWTVPTRLGGAQTWIQHVAASLATDVGSHVLDPTLCLDAEAESAWLTRFPAESLNPAAAPTGAFIQSLMRAGDVAFRQLVALTASRPEAYKHLLSDPGIAARLARLGEPVRLWLERDGPVAELFDPHLLTLATAAEQHGPLVRGEVVRVSFGMDFFADVFWDTAGAFGVRGLTRARDELAQLKDNAKP